jgi:hypothetical protein
MGALKKKKTSRDFPFRHLISQGRNGLGFKQVKEKDQGFLKTERGRRIFFPIKAAQSRPAEIDPIQERNPIALFL